MGSVFGAEYVWTGGGDGSTWTDENNWGGSGFPGESDNARFSSGAEVTITSDITVNQIYLNASSKVTCDSNVTISLNSIITQGEFLNKGTLQKRENVSFIIKVEAGGKLINENKIICTDIEGLGNSNITNNGTIEASGAATFQSGANFTNADTSELSIDGAMRNEGAFTNSGGTVTVKGTTTNTGTITNTGDFTSEGEIKNNDGGKITNNSSGTISGNINNTGGTVTNNGGTISDEVSGGTFEDNPIVVYSTIDSPDKVLDWTVDSSWKNGVKPNISGKTAVTITLNGDVNISDFQAFFSEGNKTITLNGTGNLLYNGKKIYISQKSDTELNWNTAENWINGVVPIITGEGKQEVVIVLNSDFISSETLVFNNATGAAIHIYLCNKKLSANSVQLVSDWTHPANNPAGNIHFYGSGIVETKILDASNNTNRTSTHMINLYDGTIFKITEHAYADPARGEIIDKTENCEVYLPASGFDMRVPSGKGDGATFRIVGTQAKAIEPQSYYKIELTPDISDTEKIFTFSRSETGKHNYDLNFPYVVYLMGDASWKLGDTELSDGFEGNVTIPSDNIENGTSKIEKTISLSSGTVESGDGIKVVFYTPCKNLVLNEFIYEKEIIYWTGDVSEDFSTPENWTLSETPLGSLDELTGKTVKIPSNCTNYPKLSSDISLEKLVVEDRAEVTIIDNGKLTVEKIHIYDSGALKAESGTVVFSGENPSYFAKYPEFSKFGTIEVASGTFNLNYPLTLTQLNIASGAIFSTSNELVISSIENSGDFSTTADLHIKKSLTNNGTFQAEKVYLKPSEDTVTITGHEENSEESAQKTKIGELFLENQSNKTLVINNAISVDTIKLSGNANINERKLTVKYDNENYLAGIIYLSKKATAQFLFLSDENLVTIRAASITIYESDTKNIIAENFVEKGWRLGDPSEFIWVGKTENWNEPTNWDYGTIPTSGKPVVIRTGLTNYPVLESDVDLIDETALTNEDSLIIESGAKINFAGNKFSVTNLENSGEVEFNGGSISSTSINNSGTVILTGKEEISGEISESGTVIYSGTETDAKFSWGSNYKNLEIQEGFTGSFENGVIVSDSLEIGNGFEITEKQDNSKNLLEISGTGTLSNKENISITSTGSQSFNGKINLSKILNITSDDKLTIATQSDFTNAGNILAVGFEVNATGVFKNEGTIASTSGDVKINSARFTNGAEKEIFTKNMSIDSGAVTNAGILTATGDFLVKATGDFTSQGKVEVGSELNIKSQNCTVANEISAGTILLEVSTFKSTGNLSSTGDLLITATSITNSGKIKAQNGEMETTEANILFGENSENTFTGKLVITTATDFENKGTIIASEFEVNATGDFTSQGKVEVGSELNIKSQNCTVENEVSAGTIILEVSTFESTGNLSSTGDLSITATSITNSGKIEAQNGELETTEANILFEENSENTFTGKLVVTTATDFENKGIIIASEFEVNATGDFENKGTIEVTSGNFSANVNNNFANNSQITVTAGKLLVNPVVNFTNAGNILAVGFEVTATGIFTNDGTITSTSGDVNIKSARFTNGAEKEIFAKNMSIDSGAVTNAGILTTTGDLSITATSITNSGKIKAQNGELETTEANILFGENSENTFTGKLVVTTATDFENNGIIVASEFEVNATTDFENKGTIEVTSGNFSANVKNNFANNSQITVTAGKLLVNPVVNFTNAGNILAVGFEVKATGDFTNEGKIDSSNADIRIESARFTNGAEKEIFAKNMSIDSGAVTNAGILTATGELSITATSITNSGKIKAQNGEMKTTEANILFEENSENTFTGKLVVTTATDFENKGTIEVTSGNFSANVKNNFANNSQITVTAGKLLVNPVVNFTNAGKILAVGVEVNATGIFTNEETIDSTSGDVNIKSASFINGAEKEIFAKNMSIDSGAVTNAGILKATGDFLVNATGDFTSQGKVEVGSELNIKSQNCIVENEVSAGTIILEVSTFESTGNLSSTGDLLITATSITNSGKIEAQNGELETTEANILFGENSENTFTGKLVVTTATDFENNGIIKSSEFEVNATTDFENKGTIEVTSGNFSTNVKNNFANNSQITVTTGKLLVNPVVNFTNVGNILAVGVEVNATGIFTNEGTIASKDISVNSPTVNLAGTINAETNISISGNLYIIGESSISFGENFFVGTDENPKDIYISALDSNNKAANVKVIPKTEVAKIQIYGNFALFNGDVSLGTELVVGKDLILLNGKTSGENSIYKDSMTGFDLFKYHLDDRPVSCNLEAFPTEIPNNNIKISHEEYKSTFTVEDEKTISVGKNFYSNGVNLGTDENQWTLKIPANDVATSSFAECYNAKITNCEVAANTSPGSAWLSTENCTDGTGNTNVAFSKAIFANVATISDNIIRVSFVDGNSPLDEKPEIKIENSCNEISAWVETDNFRFNISSELPEGVAFSGIFANPECTETTDGKGDLSTFYLKYDGSIDYRWNTDATGSDSGAEESTDYSRNHKNVVPNLLFKRAIEASYAGLRDEHKNRLVSVGTGTAGAEPLFEATKDEASPVLIAVTLGQEQHETEATAQHHYDSHNFIEWQFSEPVEFENYPENGISQIDGVETSAESENIQSTTNFGKITNNGNGFSVAGFGSFETGKVSLGSKTGSGEVNAFYRKFALEAGKEALAQKNRIRLSIAGYVDEENPVVVNGVDYKNWLGFIDSKNTIIPSVTFRMPEEYSKSIKDLAGNKGISPKDSIITNAIYSSMSQDLQTKTLYGTWDIDPPEVANYMKETSSVIYAQELLAVNNTGGNTAESLEIHFLDNSAYNTLEGKNNLQWRTKIGWKENNVQITQTIPLDTKGGSRMTSDSNKTLGGLRFSTIIDSLDAFVCQNIITKEYIDLIESEAGFSQTTTNKNIFGECERNQFDVPYLTLKFEDAKGSLLKHNYELKYNTESQKKGFITDLAGNLLYDFTVNSPDKNPPQFLLSIGGVNYDKLYILFSKPIDYLNQNNEPDEGKLRRIVKSLSVFESTPDGEKDTGLIDYKLGSEAKVVTKTKESTGIEISLTRKVSYDELKNLYIGVNTFDSTTTDEDADSSLGDPITGDPGEYSMLYDMFENPISEDSKHCFSDFAVNAFDVLYAYDGRAVEEAALAQGVFGGNQWTVTDFSGETNNSSKIIAGKDITIAGKIVDSSENPDEQDKFSMLADISPAKNKAGLDFEDYTDRKTRLWFPNFVKLFPVNNSSTSENFTTDNLVDNGKIETKIDGKDNNSFTYVIPNNKDDSQSVNWADGDEFEFLFKIYNSDNEVIMVDGNVDGDTDDEVDHPLFALRLKDENDITSIDLWSLHIVELVRQKGGTTILNNVINSLNNEETVVEVQVPQTGFLTVQVLTLDGNVVKVLQRGRVEEGTYYYKWNGTNISGAAVARGMYFVRVVGPNIDETRKVMVIKE